MSVIGRTAGVSLSSFLSSDKDEQLFRFGLSAVLSLAEPDCEGGTPVALETTCLTIAAGENWRQGFFGFLPFLVVLGVFHSLSPAISACWHASAAKLDVAKTLA